MLGFSPLPPNPVPDTDNNTEQKSAYHQKLEAEVEADIEKAEEDSICDEVPQPIADFVHHWFRTIHSGTDVQEALKQCERPINCDALKMVQINQEVKKYM